LLTVTPSERQRAMNRNNSNNTPNLMELVSQTIIQPESTARVSNYFFFAKEIPIIAITSPALPELVFLKGCFFKSYSATNFIESPFFTGNGPLQAVIFEIVLIPLAAFPPPPRPLPPIPASDSDLSPYTASDVHLYLPLMNRDTLTPPSSNSSQHVVLVGRRERKKTYHADDPVRQLRSHLP